MRKVLIIGNPESIWTKEYIKNIHTNDKIFLTVYSKPTEKLIKEYEALNVTLIYIFGKKRLSDKASKTLKLITFAIANKNKFDIVEIQSPPHSMQIKVLHLVVKILNAKSIAVFWGSDILAIDDKDAKRMQAFLTAVDYINLPTKQMLFVFQKRFKHAFDKKIFSAKFGSLAFEQIGKLKDSLSKSDCKEKLDLDPNRTLVAIGYNGIPAQQHIPAIEAISKINTNYKEKIQIILHMGYGINAEYFNKVVEAAQKSELHYVVIDKMLTLEEVAILRMATDVFIHAQKVDALSGTIRECIYAEAVLINPKWINYVEYDELGIDYMSYEDFNELPDLLEKLLERRINIDTGKNAKLIYKSYSWNSVKKDWMRIFDERIN